MRNFQDTVWIFILQILLFRSPSTNMLYKEFLNLEKNISTNIAEHVTHFIKSDKEDPSITLFNLFYIFKRVRTKQSQKNDPIHSEKLEIRNIVFEGYGSIRHR